MSVGPLVAALSGVPAGRIVDRLGAHKMTVSVLVGIAAGLSLLAAMRVKVGVIGYMLPIAIVTAGYAFFQAANNTAVMTGTGKEERGAIYPGCSTCRETSGSSPEHPSWAPFSSSPPAPAI